MRLERIQEGKKPRTCSKEAVEAKVRHPMAFVRHRIKQAITNLGLDLHRQTLLGRSAGRAINTRIREKRSPKRGLDVRTHGAAVQVVFVKTGPDARAELLSQAACPKAFIGHPDASDSPILVRQRTTDKPPERVAKVPVSLTQTFGLLEQP